MKKIYVIALAMAVFAACNGNSSSTESDTTNKAGDPARVQPPSAAIPDTMTIKNDSVIVPDSSTR